MSLVRIERLRVSHLPEVLPIERASYVTPWSVAMFVLELTRPDTVALCARSAGRMIGYVVCSPQASDWHVMNVSVDPGYRRRGVAGELLAEMIDQLEQMTGTTPRLTLEVRPSNDPAIKLYRNLGFLVGGRRRGYYPDDGEDALIMWRTMSTLAGRLDDVPAVDEREAVKWN
jgi:ribosomal-protein-alanine N-acetyltransferase